MTDVKDIHSDCCKNCGCVYGDDSIVTAEDGSTYIPCSVFAGRVRQSQPCGKASICWESEFLDDEGLDEDDKDEW
jgi:hypothetical protein